MEEGSPYFWGTDSDSKAGATQGQSLLWVCAVPLLVLPTPSSTGRQQAELPRTWPLRQPAAGSHPTTSELEAVFPAPSEFQHSQKYRSSKGRQVSLRSPLLHRSLSAFPPSPAPQGAGAAQMELPEAHRPQPLHRRLQGLSQGVPGTSFGNNSERQDI